MFHSGVTWLIPISFLDSRTCHILIIYGSIRPIGKGLGCSREDGYRKELANPLGHLWQRHMHNCLVRPRHGPGSIRQYLWGNHSEFNVSTYNASASWPTQVHTEVRNSFCNHCSIDKIRWGSPVNTNLQVAILISRIWTISAFLSAPEKTLQPPNTLTRWSERGSRHQVSPFVDARKYIQAGHSLPGR